MEEVGIQVMVKKECMKTKKDLEAAKSKLRGEMSAFLLSPDEFTGKNISKLKQKIVRLNKKQEKCMK